MWTHRVVVIAVIPYIPEMNYIFDDDGDADDDAVNLYTIFTFYSIVYSRSDVYPIYYYSVNKIKRYISIKDAFRMLNYCDYRKMWTHNVCSG